MSGEQNPVAIDGGESRSLRGHQTITLSLLFLAGVVNFLDRTSLSIANTTVRGEMHLSALQMGWLLSAFSLAYGVAQLPLIGMLDRVGTRAVLGGGLVVWSAAQMMTGFVMGFPMFIALRVLLGIGEAPFYPAGVRSVREWFSAATRGRATAIMSSSQNFGGACPANPDRDHAAAGMARDVPQPRRGWPGGRRDVDCAAPRAQRHSVS